MPSVGREAGRSRCNSRGAPPLTSGDRGGVFSCSRLEDASLRPLPASLTAAHISSAAASVATRSLSVPDLKPRWTMERSAVASANGHYGGQNFIISTRQRRPERGAAWRLHSRNIGNEPRIRSSLPATRAPAQELERSRASAPVRPLRGGVEGPQAPVARTQNGRRLGDVCNGPTRRSPRRAALPQVVSLSVGRSCRRQASSVAGARGRRARRTTEVQTTSRIPPTECKLNKLRREIYIYIYVYL